MHPAVSERLQQPKWAALQNIGHWSKARELTWRSGCSCVCVRVFRWVCVHVSEHAVAQWHRRGAKSVHEFITWHDECVQLTDFLGFFLFFTPSFRSFPTSCFLSILNYFKFFFTSSLASVYSSILPSLFFCFFIVCFLTCFPACACSSLLPSFLPHSHIFFTSLFSVVLPYILPHFFLSLRV